MVIPYTAPVPPDRPGDAGSEATPGGARSRSAPRPSDGRPSGGPKRPPRPDPEAANGSGSGPGRRARPAPARKARAVATPAKESPARATAKKASTRKATTKKAAVGSRSVEGSDRRTGAASSDPVTRSTGPLADVGAASTGTTDEARQPAAPVDFAPVPAPHVTRTDSPLAPAPATAPVAAVGTTATTGAVPRPGVRHGRRVKRVVRRIELWSVLKLCLVLYTCLYLAVLVSLAVVWGIAYSSGQIENLQEFLGQVGLDNYRFYGDQMFRAAAAIGAIGVLAGTILTVLVAALVNLISEMTGGIRVVVIEEDVAPVRRTG